MHIATAAGTSCTPLPVCVQVCRQVTCMHCHATLHVHEQIPCVLTLHRGKTILVTGATDGTGFHCARAFAQHGARVIIHGRNEEKARG